MFKIHYPRHKPIPGYATKKKIGDILFMLDGKEGRLCYCHYQEL